MYESKTIFTYLPTYLLIALFVSGCSTAPTKTTSDFKTDTKVTKINFQGFSLTGEQSTNEANFPYTSKLWKTLDKTILDDAARAALKSVHNPKLEITNETNDLKNDDAISAAIMLDSEDISQEKIGKRFKVAITLRGQLILFNLQKMTVISSYPLTAQLLDAPDHELNNEELAALVQELYINKNPKKKSFITEIVMRLNDITIAPSYKLKIQTIKVTVPDALANLMKKQNQTNKDMEALIARSFDKYLSKNQHVSMLPFVPETKNKSDLAVNGDKTGHTWKDQSISRLALSLSDGSRFQLEIPTPDYIVSLELKKLIKEKVGENSVDNSFVYVSKINIKSEQQQMGSTSIDLDFRYALPVTISKSINNPDDKSRYIESIMESLRIFTEQINKPDSDWLDTWIESKSDPEEQFEGFLKVLNHCK